MIAYILTAVLILFICRASSHILVMKTQKCVQNVILPSTPSSVEVGIHFLYPFLVIFSNNKIYIELYIHFFFQINSE